MFNLYSYYIGFTVVSGGIVIVVSAVLAVSTGIIVESTVVLSEVPDTFFVELHAVVAMAIDPAKARLKINFFIG
ncbi:hypothetical protein [Pedobacter sp. GR22-6]|uniref:hypothetical protein n=1 Tax=Pedobacter sp. GR22-6 TaxID=3127957 RepID=UPI00307DB81D